MQNKVIIFLITTLFFIIANGFTWLAGHQNGYKQATKDAKLKEQEYLLKQQDEFNKQKQQQDDKIAEQRTTIESLTNQHIYDESHVQVKYRTIYKEVVKYVKEYPDDNVLIPVGWMCLMAKSTLADIDSRVTESSSYCNAAMFRVESVPNK